jgi:hypothetical protein
MLLVCSIIMSIACSAPNPKGGVVLVGFCDTAKT